MCAHYGKDLSVGAAALFKVHIRLSFSWSSYLESEMNLGPESFGKCNVLPWKHVL